MKRLFKVSALLLTLVMLITLTACTKQADTVVSAWDTALYTEDVTLGEGAKTVQVEVEAEDKSITLTVLTDAETLGDALVAHSLIAGEPSEFGMYVKEVNGMTADYDVDGYYWSVCKNGEYLMTGVDTTVIADGEHYELVRTK